MKITFKILFMLFISSSIMSIYADNNDDMIADKIYKILVEEYDNHKGMSFDEKFVLKFTKKAFLDSILIWKNNFKNISGIKIILHPKLEEIAVIADENLTAEKSGNFRNLLKELSYIGYKNLDIYFLSVKDHLEKNKLTYTEINIKMIEEALCRPEFYKEKIALYDREETVKKEIRAVLKDDKIKNKTLFYVFAFDYLNKIRKKIISKDIEKMNAKIKELDLQL